MNRIEISDAAIQDLNAGYLFYESQEIGLGDYFLSSLRTDIERLNFTGGIHRRAYRDYTPA